MTALIAHYGIVMSAVEISGIFEALDEANSGSIDLAEFRKMWDFLGFRCYPRVSTALPLDMFVCFPLTAWHLHPSKCFPVLRPTSMSGKGRTTGGTGRYLD